jgi:hypothetical protein
MRPITIRRPDTGPDVIMTPGWEVARLYYGLMGADGNLHFLVEGLEGEALLDSYTTLKKIADIPNFLRGALRWFLQKTGEERLAFISKGAKSGGLSVREYWGLAADLVAFQKAYTAFMQVT